LRHPDPRILSAVLALAAAAFVALLAVEDRMSVRPAPPSTDRGDLIEMEVTVPPRVAAMLREHPVPGVRVAGTAPEYGRPNP
jgi:hypothetical protein